MLWIEQDQLFIIRKHLLSHKHNIWMVSMSLNKGLNTSNQIMIRYLSTIKSILGQVRSSYYHYTSK